MKAFVDTSAWVSYFDRNDTNHKSVASKFDLVQRNKINLITSDYIFDESVTLLSLRAGHKYAVKAGTSLLNSTVVQIHNINSELQRNAWEMFCTYADKDFSFTDCTSFALMKHLKLSRALSSDKHFRQAGFVIL